MAFDPDAYLQATTPKQDGAGFDPDAYLAETAKAPETESNWKSRVVDGALMAVNPGLAMLAHPRETMDTVERVGRRVDSYTGAPVRAAVGAMQDGISPVSAFRQQFGEDPSKAPTGRQIMEKAGVSTEKFRDLAPAAFDDGTALDLIRGGSAVINPALPFIARHARDFVGEMSPADVTGAAADLTLDATNIIPVASAAKKIVAGTESGAKALSAISRGAEAVGRFASESAAKGAKRALSAGFGPNVEAIDRYLARASDLRNAKSVEEIKNSIDGTVRALFDDVDKARLSHDEAKDALRAVETQVKDSIRDANFNFRVNQADVREQLAAARSRLDEAYKGRVDELKSKRAPVDLVDDVQTSINDLKAKVIKGSQEAYDILGASDAPVDLSRPFNDLARLREDFMVAGKGPVAPEAKAGLDRLNQLINDVGNLPAQMPAREAKKLIRQLDDSIDFGLRSGAFSDDTRRSLLALRRGVDQQLKTVPGYAEKMREVAENSGLLSEASDRFGDVRSAASRLNSIGSNAADADRVLLERLGAASGRDFREPVRQYVGAQRTLKDTRAMERIRGSLPQSADVGALERRAGEMARPEAVGRFVENSEGVRSAKAARDQAVNRLNDAEVNLAGAESRLDPYKGLTPSNTQGKIGAVMKAPGKENIEIRRTLEGLGKMSEKDFLGWIADRRAADQFKGEFRIGSRNVTLWTVLGGAAGGAPGAATGAAVGALVDRFGPKMAQKTLDAVLAMKGSPTWQGIKSLDLPSPVRSYLLTEYARMASREGEGVRAFPRSADGDGEFASSRRKGPQKWAADGAENLMQSGVDRTTIERLMSTDAGRGILYRAQSLPPNSKAMKSLTAQISGMGESER